MYLPKHFSAAPPEAVDWLVEHHPLAQIVRTDGIGQLTCDPVVLLKRGSLEPGQRLVGHVARANPLWQQDGPVLAIFTGPQAYISPNAYPSKAQHHRVVPTYNYATVQIHGQLVTIDDPVQKLAIVRLLTDTAESAQPAPWSVDDAPDEFILTQMRAIVGIEILIESVQVKFKLSQNRTSADQAGVRQFLGGQSEDNESAAMLKLMDT